MKTSVSVKENGFIKSRKETARAGNGASADRKEGFFPKKISRITTKNFLKKP
jgi:hypothetical protein